MTVAAVAWVGTKAVTADSVGTWNTGAFNADIHIEGSACRGKLIKASAAPDRMYDLAAVGRPYNFAAGQANDGDHIFAWLGAMTAVDTEAAGGLRLVIADDLGADSVGEWYVGKATGYLNGWLPFVINPKLAFDNLVAAGDFPWTLGGNPAQLTGVDGFGGGFKPLTSPPGNSPNMFVDAVSVGKGYRVTLGTSPDPAATFADIATFEAAKFGAARSVAGVLVAKCKLIIGAESGSTNTVFTDTGFTVIWETGRVAAGFYELVLKKDTGSTVVSLSNGLLAAVSGFNFALGLAGATSATLLSMTVDRADPITLDSAVTWDGGIIRNSGLITVGGGTLTNVQVKNSTSTPALSWNTADDTITKLANCDFLSAGTGHAIAFGSNTPSAITLTGVTFSGYGGTPGDNMVESSGSTDAAIYNNAGKLLTITIADGDIPAVRNGAGATTDIVSNVRTLAFTVKDNAGTTVTDYEWRLYVDDPADGILGTEELAGAEGISPPTDGSETYQYAYGGAVDVVLQIIADGFEEYIYRTTLEDANQTLSVVLLPDTNI